tara:strand:- start:21410 stop:22456 length:1047 start_codon:yes stop_codon:yes gene_type:complete
MYKSFDNIAIQSIESHYPDEYLTSSKIEELLTPIYSRLKLPEGRLELMTAIKSRGLWPKGTRPSELASIAAKKALETSNTKKEDIDLVIHSSVCRDFLEPATASVVHQKLNLKNECMSFDLSNACLGMLSAIWVAADMIESGTIKKALIVSAENSGPLLEDTIKELNENQSITRKNIKKFIANLTIGSAASAIVLSHKDIDSEKNIFEITHGSSKTDSEASSLCQGHGSIHGLVMETDSEALLKAGLKLAKENWIQFATQSNQEQSDYQVALGHQVGKAHEELIMSSLGFHKHKTHITYPTMGNTGSAALPITLQEALENNTINKNDNVILLGIGSGLTSIFLGAKRI